MKLMNKDKIVAELERLIAYAKTMGDNAINGSMQQFFDGMKEGYVDALSSIQSIGIEDVKTWNSQSEKDIYDSFNDWDYHRFVCLMINGSIQEFVGMCDECSDGSVNKHIYAVNDEYNDVDNIVYWIETPITLKQ